MVLCWIFAFLVRATGWITTRSSRRANPIARPPPQPSPSVIDLTSSPELAAAVAQQQQQLQSHDAPVENESDVDTEIEQEVPSTAEAPMQSGFQANGVQLATVAVQSAPDVREIGVQGNPSQEEYGRLSTVLKFTYMQFLRFEKNERLYNNHVELPPAQPTRHTQIMAKIDAYFLGAYCDVDPDVMIYLTELRSNIVTPLTRFDRARIYLMNLGMDHKVVEYENRRLRECELPDRSAQKRMICNVCMTDIVPGAKLLFGQCMHLVCRGCTKSILRSPNLANRCGVCRDPIGENTCITAHFKYNNRREPVCRQCWHPFNDDGTTIKMIRCGHVFHETCMQSKCMQCGIENTSENSNASLHVRWNNF